MTAETFTNRIWTDRAATSLLHENDQYARLLEWLEEFNGPCSQARGQLLAARLGTALESYMGIERGILAAAFLAEYVQRRPVDSCVSE